MRIFALLLSTMLLISCSESETPALKETATDRTRDYYSFANTDQFLTEHVSLDLLVDFDLQELRGLATLQMQRLDALARRVILDTRDLHIESVLVAGFDGEAVEVGFRYSRRDPVLGQALEITLPEKLDQQDIVISIHYRTDPTATALQWLPEALTSGGQHPFMFSQSQAIHARSWVPLQDTPAVRITYEATIRTPAELLAVMSADNDPATPRDGEYHFKMPQPIPSYLLAIAVGDIYFAPIGEKTGIYAEPEMLDAASFEFTSTQQMLDTAESMYGPYQWGRYDLLILPNSFPFGGMENPRLSFITPSVLAGDQSLVSLIAHELAHSWSGNLVTNRTWWDSWLNEGITSYLEARLVEVLFGRDRADEERVLSYRELLAGLDKTDPAMQVLAPVDDLDDTSRSQGSLPYHKGQLFLQHMENIFGQDIFDTFLTGYFKHFEFQSISSEQFLEYLDTNLLQKHPDKLNRAQAEEWIYQPGLPDDAPVPHSDTLEEAERLALAWAAGEVPVSNIPLTDWSPQATVHFINSLPVNLSESQLVELDDTLGLSQTRNAEVGRAWFIQVATRGHGPAYQAMETHLERHGRTRLIYPVYKALVENGQDAGLANRVFERSSVHYHPLTVNAIKALFVEKTR